MVAAPLKAVQGFRTLIQSLMAGALELAVPELVERVLERSGYLDALEAERTIEAQGRIENLQELVGVAQEYQETADEPSLSDFLQEISLIADQDALRDEASLVTLMTLHNAKGLEFRPSSCRDGGGDLPALALARGGEPRGGAAARYVGMTRARERLTLTHATRARCGARGATTCRRGSWTSSPAGRRARAAAARLVDGYGAARIAPRADVPDLSTGDSVRHGTLGEGVVTRSSPAAWSRCASPTAPSGG